MSGSDAEVIPFPGRQQPPRREPTLPAPPDRPRGYRVRLVLGEIEPVIWRRLDLASDLTLAELHDVAQSAMGWTDSHLHQFSVGAAHDVEVAPFLTDFDIEEGGEGIHEGDVRLDQVLERPGDSLTYLYDFGDGWEHTLVLESVEPYDALAPRARVVDGERACPPEDCGGPGGYLELLAALAHGPEDQDQRERLDWLGPFDPGAFSVEETDRSLALTLASLGGSTGVETALRRSGHGFSTVLADLVEHSRREPKPLARLLAGAEMTRLDEPDAEAKARIVRPWSHFLDLVGPRLMLTSAGWLPPAVVNQLATDLDLVEAWMGKANREQNFPPVSIIRQSATGLGLVRKRKGELVTTALGLRLAGDPESLWQHIADALPLGTKPVERHAGSVMLLAVAAGESPYDGIRRYGGGVLWSAGWADAAGGPPGDLDAIELARPTWEVLRVMGGDAPLRGRDVPSEEVRQLARAAMRSVCAVAEEQTD